MNSNERLRSLIEHPTTPYLFGSLGWLFAWQFQNILAKLMPEIDYRLGVALIFLPAGIRTLSVLVFGIRGAIGVFMGAMVSTFQYMGSLPNFNLAFSLVLSAISALTAWVAMVAVCKLRNIDDDLSQLRFSDVLAIVLSQGVISATLHQAMFRHAEISREYVSGHDNHILTDWAAMATGDITGSMILLLTALSMVKYVHKTTINKV